MVDKAFRDVVLKKIHAQVKRTFEEFEQVWTDCAFVMRKIRLFNASVFYHIIYNF